MKIGKFNSRVFCKLILIFAVMDLCLIMTACGDWESQASNIITLLGPAIQTLIAVLTAFGVGISPTVMSQFNSWSKQAQAALVTIQDLITQCKIATAAALPGLLSQIQAAIGVVAADLSTILPELHITDPKTQAMVTAGINAILGFIGTLVALVPAITSAVTQKDLKAELELHSQSRDAIKKFRKEFNGSIGALGDGKTYKI